MKATDADMNELIRGALKLHTAAMADADTWPRVVDLVRASARRRRRRRVAAVVALALAVALAAGTAVVASASGDARQLAARITRSAAQAVGISLGGSSRAPVVTPTPGFRVVGPAHLPPDLDI